MYVFAVLHAARSDSGRCCCASRRRSGRGKGLERVGLACRAHQVCQPVRRMQQASIPSLERVQYSAVPGIHEWGKLPGTDDAVLLTHGEAARGRERDNNTFMKGLFRPLGAFKDSKSSYLCIPYGKMIPFSALSHNLEFFSLPPIPSRSPD